MIVVTYSYVFVAHLHAKTQLQHCLISSRLHSPVCSHVFLGLYGYSHWAPQVILKEESERAGVKPEELLGYWLA